MEILHQTPIKNLDKILTFHTDILIFSKICFHKCAFRDYLTVLHARAQPLPCHCVDLHHCDNSAGTSLLNLQPPSGQRASCLLHARSWWHSGLNQMKYFQQWEPDWQELSPPVSHIRAHETLDNVCSPDMKLYCSDPIISLLASPFRLPLSLRCFLPKQHNTIIRLQHWVCVELGSDAQI